MFWINIREDCDCWVEWRRGGGPLPTGSSEKQMWWTSVRPGLPALNQPHVPTVNFNRAAVDPAAALRTCVSWRPRAIDYFIKPTAGFYQKGHFPSLPAQKQTSHVPWLKEKLLLLKTDCIHLETPQRPVHTCTFAWGTSGCHFKGNEEKCTSFTPIDLLTQDSCRAGPNQLNQHFNWLNSSCQSLCWASKQWRKTESGCPKKEGHVESHKVLPCLSQERKKDRGSKESDNTRSCHLPVHLAPSLQRWQIQHRKKCMVSPWPFCWNQVSVDLHNWA